jgi:Sulfotransferase domain
LTERVTDKGEIMAMKVVGAGVGRTGTLSLKTGLEQLTGQPCYHMLEVFEHPEHVSFWREAAEGGKVDWTGTLAAYGATSDFPACLFWGELLDTNPGAVVVLSTRKDSASWWESASQTIFTID